LGLTLTVRAWPGARVAATLCSKPDPLTLTSCSVIDERLRTSTGVPEEHATTVPAHATAKGMSGRAHLAASLVMGPDAKPPVHLRQHGLRFICLLRELEI
jgi:hypothetical protein